MLSNLGFNSVFTNWIRIYISSVSFEVLVNGGKSDQFKPTRGLRQGDPLSPYLFILGQEVLSRMLGNELRARNISGAKPSARGLAITHVMYVDDIILFSKATTNDAKMLANCLGKCCDWSGQSINRGQIQDFLFKAHKPQE